MSGGRQYYYYQSLRKTIVQFLDIFKNVRIARYDSQGTLTGYKKIPLMFGPKEKVWYWLHQRKRDEMLPILSVILNSIENDISRQTNKMRKIIESKTISTGDINRFINPIPYNIGFTVSVWSLHMVDVDQVLEQILPFFNPNMFTRINIPELDATLDVKVVFLTCAPDVSPEMSDEDVRVVKWNMDFIVQSYLFQPLTSTKLITKVIQKIYTTESGWNHRFTESEFTSGAGPDDYESIAYYTKAIPPYFDEPDWEANTEYIVGDIVKPTVANGFIYEVKSIDIPYLSGSTEPDWPDTDNTPVIDNNIVWERYEHDEYKRLIKLETFEV
jgi:hypothetical protein